MGEGILPFVKSDLTRGLNNNWRKNILERMLKRRALSHISAEQDMIDLDDDKYNDEEDDAEEEKTYSSYHRYKGIGNVCHNITKGLPISVVLTKENEYGCVLSDRTMLVIHMTGLESTVYGMNYFNWKLSEHTDEFDNTVPILKKCDVDDVKSCLLLLPKMGKCGLPSGNDKIYYTAIDWEWKQLNTFGVLERTQVSDIKI
jgi:hypothetical protein